MTIEETKGAMDVVSISTTVAAIVGWLPAIATILTIIWTLLRIYETVAVQQFIAYLKAKWNG